MSRQQDTVLSPVLDKVIQANPVAACVLEGLSAKPKWLPAWLFYDAAGSRLFEQITVLPEYYLTRTEREIFRSHAADIVSAAIDIFATSTFKKATKKLRLLELGAGSASKTGILLAAAVDMQGSTQYLPIDVSEAAMDGARESLGRMLHDVQIHPQIANYVTDALLVPPHDGPTLALYIGSSIGNFSPDEASAILRNLRAQLRPGDSLLLGTDMVKPAETLLAAYNDSRGVTAAFNLNVLHRLNRDLNANFAAHLFSHQAIWNVQESRIEMHLQSTVEQTVHIPARQMPLHFAAGETIHTENSYKFTPTSLAVLLHSAGFATKHTWTDDQHWFSVTLAAAE